MWKPNTGAWCRRWKRQSLLQLTKLSSKQWSASRGKDLGSHKDGVHIRKRTWRKQTTEVMGSGSVLDNTEGHSEELGHVVTWWVMFTNLTLDPVSSAVNSGMKAMFPKLPLTQEPCFLWSSCQGSAQPRSAPSMCFLVAGVAVTVLDFKVSKGGKWSESWRKSFTLTSLISNKEWEHNLGIKGSVGGTKGSILQVRCAKC